MTALAYKEHREHLKRLGVPRIDPMKQSVEKQVGLIIGCITYAHKMEWTLV